jgi:hypothetical protein
VCHRRPLLPRSPIEHPTPVVPEDEVPREYPKCRGERVVVVHEADRESMGTCPCCYGAGTRDGDARRRMVPRTPRRSIDSLPTPSGNTAPLWPLRAGAGFFLLRPLSSRLMALGAGPP